MPLIAIYRFFFSKQKKNDKVGGEKSDRDRNHEVMAIFFFGRKRIEKAISIFILLGRSWS